MIVIGYQGIGKSTLARKDKDFIDLESSNFYVDGERSDNWYEPYCNIAEHLSQQGYIVFVSSHAVVRERLKKSDETVLCCIPALELKDEWLAKLKTRYTQTGSEKDFRAWKNAEDRFTENIKEIMNSGFANIKLNNIDYDLRSSILFGSCFRESRRQQMNADLSKSINELTDVTKYRSQAKYYKKKYHAVQGKLNKVLHILSSVSEDVSNDD